MKVQRLIEKYKKLEGVWDAEGAELARQIFLQDLEQLDEPETGHADEAPRYVKNILARLRELPLHDREVWLKAIMGEFEQDFSHAKWREGHEVEKEKRYRVKFIQTGQHLAKNIFPSSEYFVIKTSSISSTDSFTQKELEEADFGWVFDCPGIKIEEVEE